MLLRLLADLLDWNSPKAWWFECLQAVILGLIVGPVIVYVVTYFVCAPCLS